MEKIRITVYDRDAVVFENGQRIHVQYDVDAYCVGGEYGVEAYFIKDNMLYIASGDDGHWWVLTTCGLSWVKGLLKALTAVNEEAEEILKSKRYKRHIRKNHKKFF